MITVIEHWCLRMQTFLEDSLPLAACLSKSAPSVFRFGFPCFNAKCFRSRSEEQQELVAELKNNERYFGKVCSLCLHGSFRKMQRPIPWAHTVTAGKQDLVGKQKYSLSMYALPTSPPQLYHCLIHAMILLVLSEPPK